jgi:hypothetical protein
MPPIGPYLRPVREFVEQLRRDHQWCKDGGFRSPRYEQIIYRTDPQYVLEGCRRLLDPLKDGGWQEGLTNLFWWAAERGDRNIINTRSLEARAIGEPRWRELFTPIQIAEAERRLKKLNEPSGASK